MEKKLILLLNKKNIELIDIIDGYLLERTMQAQNKNVEMIIGISKISKEVREICLSYGLDIKIYQKVVPKEAEIMPFHEVREENLACTYRICKGKEEVLTQNDLCLAVLSLLKQNYFANGVREEEVWLSKIIEKYNLPAFKLYLDSIPITHLHSLSEACQSHRKRYGSKVEGSYVNLFPQSGPYIYEILEMLQILQNRVKEKELDFYLFSVRDFLKKQTFLYKIADKKIVLDYYENLLTEEQLEEIGKGKEEASIPSIQETSISPTNPKQKFLRM